MAEAARLPLAVQDQLGRDLMERVERVQVLRDDIDEGVRSLDAGAGHAVDIDELIERAHRQHGDN